MQTLKIMEPYGYNIADSVQLSHTLLGLFADYYFQSIIIFTVFYLYSFLEYFCKF